jgi:hypothetical protein
MAFGNVGIEIRAGSSGSKSVVLSLVKCSSLCPERDSYAGTDSGDRLSQKRSALGGV